MRQSEGLGARRQCHCNQGRAAEDKIDPHQQAERPRKRFRQTCNDDAGQDQIDDSAESLSQKFIKDYTAFAT